MMGEVCIDRMKPNEIVLARQQCAVAYLPVGAIEWHGSHNPMGLDGIKAHTLCVRAAQAGGGVVFPILWYGEHREIQLIEANPDTTRDIAKQMQLPVNNFERGYMREASLSHRTNAYLDLLTHCFYQIRSLGYDAIYVLCGHYPLCAYAKLAGEAFVRDTGAGLFAASEHEIVNDLPLAERIGDHAGAWETSLLMHLVPELVDLSQIDAAEGDLPVGIIGQDPRQATAELGRKAVAAIVDRMIQQAGQLLNTDAPR